jgi:AraC family transcriptional regulator of adaptative response/methylated-DNA-[protein]-cysteine methyltransferase
MIALASETHVYTLHFTDSYTIPEHFAQSAVVDVTKLHTRLTPILFMVHEQLGQYFNGSLKKFSIPLALDGTAFQQRIWTALQTIPYGTTVSYQDLARAVGSPKAYRAAGSANGANIIAIIIPCHRVITSQGLGGYACGVERKQWLLDHEKRNRISV